MLVDGLRFSVVVSGAAGTCVSNLMQKSSPKRLLTACTQELYTPRDPGLGVASLVHSV